jgi:hypothetical protein
MWYFDSRILEKSKKYAKGLVIVILRIYSIDYLNKAHSRMYGNLQLY